MSKYNGYAGANTIFFPLNMQNERKYNFPYDKLKEILVGRFRLPVQHGRQAETAADTSARRPYHKYNFPTILGAAVYFSAVNSYEQNFLTLSATASGVNPNFSASTL